MLMLLVVLGLAMILLLLAFVLVWRLVDLFKAKGRWTEEADQELSEEVRP